MADDQRLKKDGGKDTRPELLDPDVLLEIGKVLKFGADKYAAELWREGISYKRVTGALLRHVFQWLSPLSSDYDDETDLHHLAHAGCCLMFLLAYELNQDMYPDTLDDRV